MFHSPPSYLSKCKNIFEHYIILIMNMLPFHQIQPQMVPTPSLEVHSLKKAPKKVCSSDITSA
jgi:hypothetical protein